MSVYEVLHDGPIMAADEFQPSQLELFAKFVEPTAIPVIGDDEIMHQAETTGDWDGLERYEYATEASISMTGLVRRFEEVYFRNRPSDERMGAPGRFIEAIWESRRQIPSIGEYASFLGTRGLLNTEEVRTAAIVAELEYTPNVRFDGIRIDDAKRDRVLGTMNEDERYTFDRTHRKLEYFANLAPGRLDDASADAATAKLADKYASKALQGNTDEKARLAAYELLLEARGVSAEDIKLMKSAQTRDRAFEYRLLGIDAPFAQHMADNPDKGLFRDAQHVSRNIANMLRGNLSTQLAARHFMGVPALYELLGYQARADVVFEREQNMGKMQMAVYNAALARGDEVEIERMQQQAEDANADADGPDSVFELPIYDQSERERFEALAAFAIHEPALRPAIAYLTNNAMIGVYRRMIEQRAPGIYQ